jgi:hypothetical protein
MGKEKMCLILCQYSSIIYILLRTQNVSDYKTMQTFMPWVMCELEIVDYQHAQSTTLQYSRKRHKYQEKLLLILQT